MDRFHAAWGRQSELLERLRETIARLQARASAPSEAVHRAGGGGGGNGRVPAPWALEASLSLDAGAPGAARRLAGDLDGLVAASVVEDVRLVASELVTNSVRHSGAPADGHVELHIGLTDALVRVEVSDRGGNGVIAPRSPDFERGGGFGLSLVRAVAERWGLEQGAAGGTRVWAELARPAPAATDGSGVAAVQHDLGAGRRAAATTQPSAGPREGTT
jgi:anti-sigma regulatory factor (Ser/Thr protein kinase)